jgi:hypothetical protein
VDFVGAGISKNDVVVQLDRDSARLGGYTGTYVIPQTISSANLSAVTASFYAQTGETGALVATATAAATVSGSASDGTVNIASFVLSGVIKAVSVSPVSLRLNAGATQLNFTATNSSGSAVAVTPGSAIWQIQSGSSFASLTPDGSLTPNGAGNVLVSATVDGITSSSATVTILPSLVAKTTFQITWPARTRTGLNSNLTSAQSVSVTFNSANGSGGDVTVNEDRQSGNLAPYTGTYTVYQQIDPSVKSMTATFYAGIGITGAVVGTATASVNLSGTTLNLASVTLSGVITKVAVLPPASISVGSGQTQLQFSAFIATGEVIAVTPGSASWKVVSGGSHLTVTPDGLATATSAGTSMVTATVDGVTSPAANVTTTLAGPSFLNLSLSASDIAYDASRNLLYICMSASSTTSPSLIVPLDLSSGSLGTPFSAGTTPTNICVSSDGSYLFAGNQYGFVTRVVLATKAVDLTITLPPDDVCVQMLPLPNSPTSFVAEVADPSNGHNNQKCVIYDGSVLRPNDPGFGRKVAINDIGTQIYGVDDYSSPNLYYSASISSSGLTNVSSNYQLELGVLGDICYQNGVVVTAGYVQMTFINASTGATLNSTGGDAVYRLLSPSIGTNNIYLLASPSFSSSNPDWTIQPYDVTREIASAPAVSVTTLSGSPAKMVAAGPNKVAFFTSGASTNQVTFVSGLP